MAAGNLDEVVSIYGMMKYFDDAKNAFCKGELKYKSGFVLQVTMRDHTVHGIVRASMKDRSYNVEVLVDGCGNILDAKCACPNGKDFCSHMVATAIYANRKGVSKTNLPNSWMSKPKSSFSETKPISQIFPDNKPFQAIARPVNSSDKKYLFERLRTASSDCPMRWIVGPEPELSHETDLNPPHMEELIPVYLNDTNEFLEKCKVNASQIKWLENVTAAQRKCPIWGKFRSLRLTSSNFGRVIHSYDRHYLDITSYPPSLFNTLQGEYNLTKDAILWGQVHESSAMQKYSEVTEKAVKKIGLVLFPCGFLGSSPDGVVLAKNGCVDVVVEAKCPWSYRNFTVEEMVMKELSGKHSKKGFYLTSEFQVNRSHQYWHQVQAQIFATNARIAHFVVWTCKDFRIIQVEKDTSWARSNIPKLTDFYINVLLKRLFVYDSPDQHSSPITVIVTA